MAGAVGEEGFLVFLTLYPVPKRRVDHDYLVCDPTRLSQEPVALRAVQVAAEVAGDEAVEGGTFERWRERVADEESAVRDPSGGDLDYPPALIQPDYLAP